MFSPTRYPVTYAVDYLRELVDFKISRAEASRLITAINHPYGHVGKPSYTSYFALADKYFEKYPEEEPTSEELRAWREKYAVDYY